MKNVKRECSEAVHAIHVYRFFTQDTTPITTHWTLLRGDVIRVARTCLRLSTRGVTTDTRESGRRRLPLSGVSVCALSACDDVSDNLPKLTSLLRRVLDAATSLSRVEPTDVCSTDLWCVFLGDELPSSRRAAAPTCVTSPATRPVLGAMMTSRGVKRLAPASRVLAGTNAKLTNFASLLVFDDVTLTEAPDSVEWEDEFIASDDVTQQQIQKHLNAAKVTVSLLTRNTFDCRSVVREKKLARMWRFVVDSEIKL